MAPTRTRAGRLGDRDRRWLFVAAVLFASISGSARKLLMVER